MVCLSALPLWLLVRYAQSNPHATELFYSKYYYPFVLKIHQTLLGKIPFSVGDILYLALLLLLTQFFIKKIPHWRIKPLSIFLDLFSIVIVLAWIFHLSWGFNYHRLPLNEQLGISLEYTEQDLEDRLDELIEMSNRSHSALSTSDTLAVKILYSKEVLAEKIKLDFIFPDPMFLETSEVKKSLFSLPLSYMGFAGYLNPFTLESQVNALMPKLSIITTAMHEMAHQLGHASEKEANFIAYLSAIKSSDPYFQFAGHTFAFRYCYSEMKKIDPKKAAEKLKALNPGIIKNFKALSLFWKQYENPFEFIFEKTYDSYLKANGQKTGIKSYNEMVGLVINYHKKQINTEKVTQRPNNFTKKKI